MWPALLFCGSTIGLALGLARLKALALIPATIILSLTAAVSGVAFGLGWGIIALTIIIGATILQSSYLIGGLLSETPSTPVASRVNLRPELIRAAQFAIGEELKTQFHTPRVVPRQIRTRMKQLALRYG